MRSSFGKAYTIARFISFKKLLPVENANTKGNRNRSRNVLPLPTTYVSLTSSPIEHHVRRIGNWMLKFECVRASASAAHWDGDTAPGIAYER
jgi:hypothetical protein